MIKCQRYKPARIKNPYVDGHSVRLFVGQSLNIYLDYDEKYIDENRVILDSLFLYCSSITRQVKKIRSGKEQIFVVYEIKQKYDLSLWAKSSVVFLGEINVNSSGKYIRVGAYLNSQSINTNELTVIHPTNTLIKVQPETLLKVVLLDDLHNGARFNFKIKDKSSICNVDFVRDVYIDHKNPAIINIDAPHIINNLQPLNNFIDEHPFSYSEEQQFYFWINPNVDLKRVSEDTYDGGIMEFSRTSHMNEKPTIMSAGFLKLLVSIKESKIKNSGNKICLPQEKNSLLTARSWDVENRVLINPGHLEDITLYEPDLSFVLEIAEPSIFNSSVTDTKWEIVRNQRVDGVNGQCCIVYSLPDELFGDLPLGKNTIQRFRLTADVHGNVLSNKILGQLELQYSFNGISISRLINVNVAPKKKNNYILDYSDKIRSKVEYPTKSWYSVSNIEINRISGELDQNAKVQPVFISKYTNDKTIYGPNKNLVKPVGTTPITTVNSQIHISNNVVSLYNLCHMNSVTVRCGNKLIITFASNNIDEIKADPWICNVFQDKTYLIHYANNFVDNKQIFEFHLLDFYLPNTNNCLHYLSGIKFIRRNSKDSSNIKYVGVYLSHNSKYDKETYFSSEYLATAFLNRYLEKKKAPFIESDAKNGNLKISNWSNNSGLILQPEKSCDLILPEPIGADRKIGFTNGKWHVRLKQYPIPKCIFQELGLRDIVDRLYPWWPDELLPEDAFMSLNISPIIEYQPHFHEIMEVYYKHFNMQTLPIGELIFRSDIIEQNREVDGTLVKMRQKYSKKVYLYALYFDEFLDNKLQHGEDADNAYSELSDIRDGQSVYVNYDEDFRVILDGKLASFSLAMIPSWMKLHSVYVGTKRTMVFKLSKPDIEKLSNSLISGWLLFNKPGCSETVRIQVTLSS